MTPSLHDGWLHTPNRHTPLAQSVFSTHSSKLAHLDEQLPPQSVSVSSPFATPSVQVAAKHTFVPSESHTRVTQSSPVEQPASTGHLLHTPPPQSTAVSMPFITASVHVGAVQAPVAAPAALKQMPLAQSKLLVHAVATGQPSQSGPPQSTAIS